MDSKKEIHESLEYNLEWTEGMSTSFPRGVALAEVIRRKCIDCTCGNKEEITHCPIVNCALWPFRSGAGNPFHTRKKRTKK